MTPEPPTIDHRAALVSSRQSLVSEVANFVREAPGDADELSMLVVSERAIPALADALADRLDKVIFGPAERVFPGSCQAMFRLWDDAMQQAVALGCDRVRLVGQPVWYTQATAEEWCAYEELTNVAFDGWPLSVLCVLYENTPLAEREKFLRVHPRTSSGRRNTSYASCSLR